MTPELAQAIDELRRAVVEEGSTLARNAPKVSAAITRVLRAALKGTR